MGTSAAIEGFRTLLKELQAKQMKLEKDQLKLQRTVFGWKRFFLGFKKFRHTFEKIMKNNIRRDKMLKDLSYQMMQLKSGKNRKMWRTRDKVKKTYLDDSRAHDTCRNVSEPFWKVFLSQKEIASSATLSANRLLLMYLVLHTYQFFVAFFSESKPVQVFSTKAQ